MISIAVNLELEVEKETSPKQYFHSVLFLGKILATFRPTKIIAQRQLHWKELL